MGSQAAELNMSNEESQTIAISSMESKFSEMQLAFSENPYPELVLRLEQLNQLKMSLIEHQKVLTEALSVDYGFRSQFDSLLSDIMPTVGHINYTTKRLAKWLKPSKRHAGLLLYPSSLKVQPQPLGVVGVIVPWNFPVFLSIAPIVTALAAGNRVMVKLSEFTPATNQVLRTIFANLSDVVDLVEGGPDVASNFSQLPFDHLLFTGSTKVGTLVAQAAAKNLTPITLELGGKSPVIVAQDADLTKAVDAIMLGKSVNAGQICVAPDYVFVPKGKQDQFIKLYKKRFASAYSEKQQHRGFTHVINRTQYLRLQSYLADATEQGAAVHSLGESDEGNCQMLPQLVTGVTNEMLLMKEEIFGPILPIIEYDDIEDPIRIINKGERPLALYLMTNEKALQKQVALQTHCGGMCVNDTLLHVAADDAPFGGIGPSGMGHYHGIEGFRTFSHQKTILTTPSWLPRSRLLNRYKAVTKSVIGRLFIR